jgi:hypothetical protein
MPKIKASYLFNYKKLMERSETIILGILGTLGILGICLIIRHLEQPEYRIKDKSRDVDLNLRFYLQTAAPFPG